jgi:hypothetical protein
MGKKMAYDILKNEMPIGVSVLFLENFLLRVLKLSKQSSKYTTNLDEGFCANGNFMKGAKRKTDDSSNLQNIKYYIQCAHRPIMGAHLHTMLATGTSSFPNCEELYLCPPKETCGNEK